MKELGTCAGSSSASERMAADDCVLPETRWLAVPVVAILATTSLLLYLFPNDTERLFAWTIKPAMTPLIMGAGCGAGAWFWARVATAQRWHHAGLGLLPTATFAGATALATVLHWDRFNHDHVVFLAWALIYVVGSTVQVVQAWYDSGYGFPTYRRAG